MLPSSDDLEALHARVKQAAAALKKVGGAEVTKAGTKETLAGIARDWLKLSPSPRQSDVCEGPVLDSYDEDMQALLTGTTTRARASALRKRLERFAAKAVDQVIVPLIQFEGSPRQVAARQIQAAFPSNLEAEEAVYIEEAARCLTVQAFRAAIIMLWAAGVARMHRAVVNRGFNAFNSPIDSCIAKKGVPFNKIKEGAKISSLPELQRSRDADVLIVGLESFGYDLQTFQELDRMLGTRNDAAHPGQFQPNGLDVQQFAQKLGLHVFQTVTL
jgi:hypothetical protein